MELISNVVQLSRRKHVAVNAFCVLNPVHDSWQGQPQACSDQDMLVIGPGDSSSGSAVGAPTVSVQTATVPHMLYAT